MNQEGRDLNKESEMFGLQVNRNFHDIDSFKEKIDYHDDQVKKYWLEAQQ